MTKKLSLDDLGAMIASGFASMDEKFSKKLAELKTELANKIDAIDLKLSAQSTSWKDDFNALDDRVSQNEIDINALNNIVLKKH